MRKTYAATIALAAAALIAPTAGCESLDQAAPVQSADGSKAAGSETATGKPPVKLTATAVDNQAVEFASGGPYTCVQIAMVNQTRGQVESNPFYFAITGTDKVKRNVTLMADRRELETMSLAPGETAKGVICSEGEFTPDVVAFDDFTHRARAQVAR